MAQIATAPVPRALVSPAYIHLGALLERVAAVLSQERKTGEHSPTDTLLARAVICRLRMAPLRWVDLHRRFMGSGLPEVAEPQLRRLPSLDEPRTLAPCLDLSTPVGYRTALLFYNVDSTELVPIHGRAKLAGWLPTAEQLREEERVNPVAAQAHAGARQAVLRRLSAPVIGGGASGPDTVWYLVPDRNRGTSLTREQARGYIAYLRDIIPDSVPDSSGVWAALDSAAEDVVNLRHVQDRVWLPVRNGGDASWFWQQTDWAPLNIGALAVSRSSKLAFTEVTSPLLHAVRLSLNAIVASSDTQPTAVSNSRPMAAGTQPTNAAPETDATVIDRFRAGGGNFNLGALFPLYHRTTQSEAAQILVLLAPHVGGTISAGGAPQPDASGMWDAGVELYLASADHPHHVGAYFAARMAEAGGNRVLLQSVGAESQARFTYLAATVGVILGGNYVLTASRIPAGPRGLVRSPVQLGLSIVRSPAH